MMRLARLVGCLAVATGLAACGSGQNEELQEWMAQQRSQAKPTIKPIPAPKQFSPQGYEQASQVEPFSNQKLVQALRREQGQSSASTALVAPELARRKEPLESFPLDAAAMVGSLVKNGQFVALVRVDNLLYQLRSGNYIGQNYGRITKITESSMELREIVQDAAGEWIERTATLQLQERLK